MYAGRIYADFQNLDDENRIRLTTAGSRRDLEARAVSAGEHVGLYCDDTDDQGNFDPLLAESIVEAGSGSELVARVDWATTRHASYELAMLKKRFFDTAIGDVLRSLDGGALIGATLQSLCILDHLGFLRTGRGNTQDFEAIVGDYLVKQNVGYEAKWLWAVRNGLAHAHGRSEATRTGKQSRGVCFIHLQPKLHLTDDGSIRRMNVDTLVADVITTAWMVFDDFKKSPEKPLEVFRELLIVGQPDVSADKPYGDMHRTLSRLDTDPPDLGGLSAEIVRTLSRPIATLVA
jgi:hypothetical protein